MAIHVSSGIHVARNTAHMAPAHCHFTEYLGIVWMTTSRSGCICHTSPATLSLATLSPTTLTYTLHHQYTRTQSSSPSCNGIRTCRGRAVSA